MDGARGLPKPIPPRPKNWPTAFRTPPANEAESLCNPEDVTLFRKPKQEDVWDRIDKKLDRILELLGEEKK